jgi:hypothetical protein
MSAAFVVMSGLVLALPVIFLVIGLTNPPMRVTFIGTAVAVAIGSLGVWLFYKPKALDLSKGELVIRFSMRELPFSRDEIVRAEVLTKAQLRTKLGYALRVGVGGLFGVFGLLWTQKLGWVSVYVTTLEPWLLVTRKRGRPLLLSPRDPEAVARLLGRAG